MNADAVAEALASLAGDVSEFGKIERILGGWSFDTFAVEPAWIFRFPRNDAVARALDNEIRLLPALGDTVSFAVPRFEWIGRFRGWPFAGYRRIAGRPLERADVEDDALARAAVAQMLAQLHGFPLREAAARIGADPTVPVWMRHYEELFVEVERRVLPVLSSTLQRRVRAGYARFLDEHLASFSHPVLVHCDLGCEHILVSPETGMPVGMIDFEEAAIGDPAIDFVGLRIATGEAVTRDILARYGGPTDSGFADRLHFYRWMGSVHAILYGLDEADEAIVEDGVRGLDERLTAPG